MIQNDKRAVTEKLRPGRDNRVIIGSLESMLATSSQRQYFLSVALKIPARSSIRWPGLQPAVKSTIPHEGVANRWPSVSSMSLSPFEPVKVPVAAKSQLLLAETQDRPITACGGAMLFSG